MFFCVCLSVSVCEEEELYPHKKYLKLINCRWIIMLKGDFQNKGKEKRKNAS